MWLPWEAMQAANLRSKLWNTLFRLSKGKGIAAASFSMVFFNLSTCWGCLCTLLSLSAPQRTLVTLREQIFYKNAGNFNCKRIHAMFHEIPWNFLRKILPMFCTCVKIFIKIKLRSGTPWRGGALWRFYAMHLSTFKRITESKRTLQTL